jgi:flagellar biosynthesis GTPase FlhF
MMASWSSSSSFSSTSTSSSSFVPLFPIIPSGNSESRDLIVIERNNLGIEKKNDHENLPIELSSEEEEMEEDKHKSKHRSKKTKNKRSEKKEKKKEKDKKKKKRKHHHDHKHRSHHDEKHHHKKKHKTEKEKLLELDRKYYELEKRKNAPVSAFLNKNQEGSKPIQDKIYFWDLLGDRNNLVFFCLYQQDIPYYRRQNFCLGLEKTERLIPRKEGYFVTSSLDKDTTTGILRYNKLSSWRALAKREAQSGRKHIISYHIISYHIISHIISYHIIYQDSLKLI